MERRDGRPSWWAAQKEEDENHFSRARIYADRKTREIVWRQFVVNKVSGECIESLEMRFNTGGNLVKTEAVAPRFSYDGSYYRKEHVEAKMKELLQHPEFSSWLGYALMFVRRNR